MKVAVVGAGIFGCTTAIELAKAGHEVTLYDRRSEIMYAASRANQGRLHWGFHYPRSKETARACRAGAASFVKRFPEAIYGGPVEHYYAIAKEGSYTSPAGYLAFLKEMDMEFWEDWPPWISHDNLAWCIRALDESIVDLDKLRMVLYRDLAKAHVRLFLKQEIDQTFNTVTERIVDASFGRWLPWLTRQWEVVEVALFQLPAHLATTSLVVLDGPFASIDPVPGTHPQRHILYDVQHSVHSCNVGRAPYVPDQLVPYVDDGQVRFDDTRWEKLRASAARFVPDVAGSKFRMSMLTVRAVQVEVEDTDARPTVVGPDPHGIIRIFPGKIDTVMDAAAKAVHLVGVG